MHQTQAERVLGKFADNLKDVAALSGHPYKRLWNWMRAGAIPPEYHQGLLNIAAERQVDLHPFDFVAHLHRPVVVPEQSSQPAANGVSHNGQQG